jgi:hypothetical protein
MFRKEDPIHAGATVQAGTPMTVTGDGPPSTPFSVCAAGGGLSAAREAHV